MLFLITELQQEFDSTEHFKAELIDYLDNFTTTAVSKQSERVCRLIFTDNKPFRLLNKNIV